MQPLQPEQAHFLLHSVYLPQLKNEHRTTKSVIEAIPIDKASYRPDPIAMNAADLAWHIVSAEMAFLSTPVEGAFEPSRGARPETAELASWYEENFQREFDALAQVPGEQLAKIVNFRGAFQLPAVMYVNFGIVHSIHHRGQLSTYLRPMGAKVPSIYGPSYDSAQAAKSGS